MVEKMCGTLQLGHADMWSTLCIQSFEAVEGSMLMCIAHPNQFNMWTLPKTRLETYFKIEFPSFSIFFLMSFIKTQNGNPIFHVTFPIFQKHHLNGLVENRNRKPFRFSHSIWGCGCSMERRAIGPLPRPWESSPKWR